MDCKKANEFMMKFMDGNLSEKEASELGEHISQCQECKEDFLLYNSMLEEFSNIDNIISAPDNFEIQVMAKIDLLEPIYLNSDVKTDRMLCTLWGISSIIAGLGTILAVNKEAITSFIMNTPSLSVYANMLSSVEGYVVQFKDSLFAAVNSILEVTGGYVTSLKYVSLIAFVLLVVAQYFIYKKDKVEI